MSKLRERLQKIAEPANDAWKNMQEEKRDGMQMSDSQVCRDYPDAKYRNAWNTVSPLAILMNDHINTIMGEASVQAAADFVKDNIEALNSKYSGDPFYGTMSDAYVKKLWYQLTQCRTMDQVLNRLSNALVNGYEGNTGKGKSAEVEKTNTILARMVAMTKTAEEVNDDIIDSLETTMRKNKDFTLLEDYNTHNGKGWVGFSYKGKGYQLNIDLAPQYDDKN